MIASEPCFESRLYKTMYRSLSYFGGLMFLFGCVVLSWTILEMTLIQGIEQVPSVAALDESVWDMLMIINTANWPTPIISFYEKATIKFTYFIAYSVVVDWGFLNLVLGLIVAFFEDSFMGEEVEPEVGVPQAEEDDSYGRSSKMLLGANTAKDLSIDRPYSSEQARNVLGDDDNDDDSRDSVEGSTSSTNGGRLSVAKASNLPGIVEQTDSAASSRQVSIVNTDPAVHNPLVPVGTGGEGKSAGSESAIEPMQIEEPEGAAAEGKEELQLPGVRGWWRAQMRFLHPYVEHTRFNLFCDLVLFVLGFNFLFGPDPRTILTAQIVLNSIELLVRILVRSGTLTHFFLDSRHVSNTLFIVVLVSTSVSYFAMCSSSHLGMTPACTNEALQSKINPYMDGHVVFTIILIRTCIVVRILLVTRNFGWDYIPTNLQLELARAGNIILETSKALAHLVIMLLTIMYIYSSMGMHFFGGALSKNPDLPRYHELIASDYAMSGYWPLNFNDMPSAFTTMFTLLYINNMQIVTSGCTAVTSMNAELFFGSFYIVGVLYVRNIFTSFLWSRIGKILDPEANPIEGSPRSSEISAPEIRMSAITSMVLDSQTLVRHSSIGRGSSRTASCSSIVSNASSDRRAPKNKSLLTMVMSSTHSHMGHNDNVDEGTLLKSQVLDNLKSTTKEEDILIEEYMAVIVLNAKYGLILEPFKKRISLWAFKLRSAMFRYVLISCWALTILRIFQTPPWVLDFDPRDYEGRTLDSFWFSQVGFMSANLTTLLKVPLLLSLQFMLVLEIISKKDMKHVGFAHIARYIMLAISFTSMITLLISLTGNKYARRLDWYLSFFSISYTMWFDRTAMKRMFIVLGVLPKLVVLMFALGIFVSISAIFADVLFDPADLDHGDDDYNARYYRSYFQSIWTIFVAITSSSYPAQFMPATRAYREFALFFISVISVGGFIILEGAIALVNTSYQGGVVVVKQAENKTKEKAVDYVFEIFSSINQKVRLEKSSGRRVSVVQGGEVVSASQVDKLCNELYSNYGEFMVTGRHGPMERAILRTIMDINGDGKVCKEDFSFFYSVSRIKIKKVPPNYMSQKEKAACKDERRELRAMMARSSSGIAKVGAALKLGRERYSKCFKESINSTVLSFFSKKHWDMLADSVTGLMGIACVLSKASFGTHELFAWSMVVFMFLEFLSKWFLLGIQSYFRNMRNKIDFFIMWMLLLVLIWGIAHGHLFQATNGGSASAVLLDVTVMLRLFLYPRNVAIFSAPVNGVKWSSVLGTIARLSFAFAEAFICLGFTYAQLGVLFYGGVIPRVGLNAALDKSPFGQNNFYILNFNDMTSSFFTLFCCLRVSDWDVVAQGVVTVTDKMITSRIFFSMWYLLGVVLMLNILKSYFVIVFRSKPRASKLKMVDEFGIELDTDMLAAQVRQSEIESLERKQAREAAKELQEEAREANELASDDECDDEDAEKFDKLELMNITGHFVIDLVEMIERRDFVGLNEPFLAEVRKEREEELARMKANTDEKGSKSFASNRFRFNVKLPYKQGMEEKDRTLILKRMLELSMQNA